MSCNLNQQNEQADALIRKLKRIKKLWDKIFAVEEIERMAKAAGELAESLDWARETCLSDDFPSAESLDEVARPAAELAESLGQVMEIYMSEDFPTADLLEEIARPAAELGRSLGQTEEAFLAINAMADGDECEFSREDEVAAILFESALTPETIEEMRKELLDLARKQEKRPAPNTRPGLLLIYEIIPHIEQPNEEEIYAVMPRVKLLLNEEEKQRLEN